MNHFSRRQFLQTLGLGSAALFSTNLVNCNNASDADLPNIIIIFTDDQGYADVGCFGARDIDTPNLDKMATDGVRFTDFYVTQAVCGASRAGLLTGCYPNRIGLFGAPGPNSTHGIHSDEMTIAELLKQKNYATAVYGKWHLGHHLPFLPTQNGFDEYFGLPYSNDMWPKHPERPQDYPDLPLMENEKIIEYNPDQTQLTTWYTERAVNFIEKNKTRLFFLYVAHNMPHVPLFVSDKFKGKSERGLYGDVIMEIDWSVGEILQALERNGLSEKTLVIFTSDNGPWLSYGDHAGSKGNLREGKGTVWEGGVRVPCIMRWPGKISQHQVCDEPAMTIDILPTIARITGTQLPEHTIDGLNILPLMKGEYGAQSPHEALNFYWDNRLQAIRSGRWKLHFPHPYRTMEGQIAGSDGMPGKYRQNETGLVLFDLENDPGESTDVAAQHPNVVEKLQALAESIRGELGDGERKGKSCRPAGQI
ncbi:sulfatase [candidate division KSB1 bacterium]|nr:sulfatase [candidate division KSB1 bacterium]